MSNARIAISTIAVAYMALLCAGCEQAPKQSVHLVVLPDLSASIEPRAEQDALKALSKAAASMHRGDSFTVIPITGDADDDDQGRILRWNLPETREPFDGDLLHLEHQEQSELRVLFGRTLKHPYRRTDIFGALRLARQELAGDPPGTVKEIAILSDFIEDDRQYHFAKDRRLRNPKTARHLAIPLAQGSRNLYGVRIYLGGLASTDLRRLGERRREAIRAFWERFLGAQGARVEWASDGPGRLASFFSNSRQAVRPNPGR